MHIQAVTMSVANMEKSREFYEEILGFEPAYATAEPYRWQAYRSDEEAFFAIIEVSDLRRTPDMDIVNFVVEDVEQLWKRAEGRVDVEQGLHLTLAGRGVPDDRRRVPGVRR